MKKNLWIVAVVIFLFLMVVMFFMYSFRTHVEKTKVSLSKEVIYLKHLSRGVSFEADVISVNSYTKAAPDTMVEYVSWVGRGFYYKIENDSLYIYGDNWINPSIKTISNIRFISIGKNYFYYLNNYKKIGLKYFPPSSETGTYINGPTK